MHFTFITAAKYSGRSIRINDFSDPFDGVPISLLDLGKKKELENKWPSAFKMVSQILEGKGLLIRDVSLVLNENVNSLNNEIYQIITDSLNGDGEGKVYYLKIFNNKTARTRECLAWKSLGFDAVAGRPDEWVPGLPSIVHYDELNAFVLTPGFRGALKPKNSGTYELPMVLCMVLCIARTLQGLHDNSLLYMDCHPGNILYDYASRESQLIFFLGDMGGVRPRSSTLSALSGLPQEVVEEILNEVITKEEVRPPVTLFPVHRNAVISNLYDVYTLAKTASLLLGVEIPFTGAHSYAPEITLEAPLKSTRQEIVAAVNILSPVLSAQTPTPMDRAAVTKLFKKYFMDRAEFAGKHLSSGGLGDAWRDLLLQRYNFYCAALDIQKRSAFLSEIQEAFQSSSESENIDRELEKLNRVPDELAAENYSEADNLLTDIYKNSSLIKISKTAVDSYMFHRKLLRLLMRTNPRAPFPSREGSRIQLQSFFSETEDDTIKAIRAGEKNLYTLTKEVAFS